MSQLMVLCGETVHFVALNINFSSLILFST